MVSASSAKARFPRPASKSCRIRPTVSNAPIKSSRDNAGVLLTNSVGNTPRGVPANRYVIYFALAALGVGLDLWTKHAIFRWRGLPRAGNVYWLIEHRFGIETSVNPGAL